MSRLGILFLREGGIDGGRGGRLGFPGLVRWGGGADGFV